MQRNSAIDFSFEVVQVDKGERIDECGQNGHTPEDTDLLIDGTKEEGRLSD